MKISVETETIRKTICLSATKPGDLVDLTRRKALAFSGLTSGVKARQRAFTLIELLVVIAIIAILAAILMPVLERAQARGQQISCLNNYKQLQLCYQMYFDDNNNLLPLNYVNNPAQNWVAGFAQTDVFPLNLPNIENAVIFPYNKSVKIYACPADTRICKTTTLPLEVSPQTRSCSIEYSMGGNSADSPTGPWTISRAVTFNSCGKANQIRNPSLKYVFDEESQLSLDDGELGMYPLIHGAVLETIFWNLPSNRHNNGSNFSFLDGHCEYHHWLGPIENQTQYQGDNNAVLNGLGGDIPDVATDPDLVWCETGGAQGN